MTHEEAKAFYKIYNGCSFHMGREEPSKDLAFRHLNIPAWERAQWDEELIDEAIFGMKRNPARVWTYVSDCLAVLGRNLAGTEANAIRLLYTLEQLPLPDEQNRILILEHMSLKDNNTRECGCRIFAECTGQLERLNKLMEEYLAAGGEMDPERFIHAKALYRATYRKYKN